MDPIANPIFDSNTANTLINQGHVWIGVGLCLLQLVLIPSIAKLFKHYTNQNKALIDAERQVTKLERDAQVNSLNTRMTTLESNSQSNYTALNARLDSEVDRLKEAIEGVKKALDKFEVKLDKVLDKLMEHTINEKS